MIINSSPNSNLFDSSNVKDISGQNKIKLIINSNNSVQLKLKKANTILLKKGS